jgi:hypothetical protein
MNDRNDHRLTHEQMNELVVDDVDDPSAWGDSVVVGPSRGRRKVRMEASGDGVETSGPDEDSQTTDY